MSVSTHTFPVQRVTQGHRDHAAVQEHDHAWRQIEDPEQRVLLGMYRCDLCEVVWAL